MEEPLNEQQKEVPIIEQKDPETKTEQITEQETDGQRRGLTMPMLGDMFKSSSRLAKDSGSYREVALYLDSVNEILGHNVTPETYRAVGGEGIVRYNQLVEACKAYLNSHKWFRWTSTGRYRKFLVQQILDLAGNDLKALLDGAPVVARKGSMTMLDLVSSEARTEKIDLGDGKDVTKVGGGSSTRLVFKQGDKTVFFTEEEKLRDEEGAKKHVIDSIEDDGVREVIRKMYADETARGKLMDHIWLNAGTDPNFLSIINKGQVDNEEPEYKTMADYVRERYGKDLAGFGFDFKKDENCQIFSQICIALVKAKQGSRNFQEMGMIAVGSTTSSRNAAMTRLADLLGIGELLARSVNAEITIKGKKIKGNLMEKAKGEQLTEIGKSKLQSADVTSGELQRQFVCLQIIDALCGQVDRNVNNFMLESEKDESGNVTRFTSIQGIDNDMAFGDITDLSKSNDMLKPVITKEGASTLPYMDKELGEKMLMLTPDMVKFAVADIIGTEAEVNAMLMRLEQIQTALRELKKRGETDGKDYFIEKQAWGETTRLALMGDPTKKSTNYYARFIDSLRKEAGNGNLGKSPAPPQQQEIVPETAAVSSFVMNTATLSFLINRKDVSKKDRQKLHGMLEELLDTYHRADKSGSKRMAQNALTRIAEVCKTRQGELKNKAAKQILGRLGEQCTKRLSQITGLPEQDLEEKVSSSFMGSVTDLQKDEIVALEDSDPFPDYPRLTVEEAKKMSASNEFNTGAHRETLYGVDHGYIQTPNSSEINKGLRGERTLSAESKKTVKTLDQASCSAKMTQKARFHRMLSSEYLQYALKLDSVVSRQVSAKNAADVNKMTGTVITDDGFMCVGYLVDLVFSDAPVMLTLLADVGTPVFPTDNHAESEMIFGRNTSYMILGARLHGEQGGGAFPLSNAEPGIYASVKGKYKGLEIFAKIIKK
jgi:hypothetical protein